jgi:hypothetical protein
MFGKVARECIQILPYNNPMLLVKHDKSTSRLLTRSRPYWRYGECGMPISGGHWKSIDVTVCRLVLDICREWVFARHDGSSTMREKAGLLAKMTCLEYKRFEEPILADFLNPILDVYKEPSLRRTDLTIKLESAFLVGCRSKDPVVHVKFVELFNDGLPRALASRLTLRWGTLLCSKMQWYTHCGFI